MLFLLLDGNDFVLFILLFYWSYLLTVDRILKKEVLYDAA